MTTRDSGRLGLAAVVVVLALAVLAPAAASAAYREEVLADSPNAYWRLGESDGPTAANETGPSHAGTYRNGIALGQAGATLGNTAAGFDGADDTVAVPDAVPLSPSGAMSLEAWIKPARLSSSVAVVGKGKQYQLRVTTTGAVRLDLWKKGSNTFAETSSGLVAVDRYSHLVATWDGVKIRLYVDGVLRVTKKRTGQVDATPAPLFIGSEQGSSGFVAGAIDEVALYTYPLSAGRVTTHFRAGLGTTPTPGPPPATPPPPSSPGPPPPLGGGIVGLWHMDETAGTTMVDSSGNGNDGVISGATLGREGTAGLAYEFGTQSLVRAPTTMNPGAQDFSVSMWINFTEPPPSDTSDLIRKGFSNTSGGDFKMEIWPAGNIQCYFRSTTKSVTVKSVGDISDGAWHFVMCRRAGSTFITVVDGATWTGSGSIGSISNTSTLNIGAKNANEDHYLGLMDDVQMTIG